MLAYAVLAVPLVVLTYGARADIAGVRVYRLLFDHLPFLSLQRVPERLMVVTALVLVLLAVSALDVAGELLAGSGPLRSMTGDTITDPPRLRAQLDEVRSGGLATEGEFALIAGSLPMTHVSGRTNMLHVRRLGT